MRDTEAFSAEIPKASAKSDLQSPGSKLDFIQPAPKVLRAGVITGPMQAGTRQHSIPELVQQEILVRVEGCGVCGSTLPLWEGRPWFKYPLDPGAPGHEVWGVVEAVAVDVTEIHPGDHVAILSDHGFAEYDITLASKALVLPPLFRGMLFPGEALGCAMNIARRSRFRKGEEIAIVGIGFLGALLTRLAKNAGTRVIAISRRKFSLEMAERFGADEVFGWGEHASQRNGFDCVVECAGSQESLDLATRLTKERGRLIIAGYHQDGLRQVDMQVWNWRGLDVINAHERDPQIYLQGIRAAMEAIISGVLDPAPLFTHSFSLEELPKAFEMLRLRPAGFMKALVLP